MNIFKGRHLLSGTGIRIGKMYHNGKAPNSTATRPMGTRLTPEKLKEEKKETILTHGECKPNALAVKLVIPDAVCHIVDTDSMFSMAGTCQSGAVMCLCYFVCIGIGAQVVAAWLVLHGMKHTGHSVSRALCAPCRPSQTRSGVVDSSYEFLCKGLVTSSEREEATSDPVTCQQSEHRE